MIFDGLSDGSSHRSREPIFLLMQDTLPSKHVTMRDVGQALGVSHVTVSLALRNHKSIPEHHRLRIQAKADEMGYTRNAAATTLACFRASSRERRVNERLAWLNFWESPEELRSYGEFNAYWNGATEEAKKLGYRLEEFICKREPEAIKQLASLLLNKGIEGLLIPPHRFLTTIEGFPWEKFSAVRLGRGIPQLQLHIVSANQLSDTMLAYRKLKELGYQRIGFISGRSFQWGGHFQGGYILARQSLGDTESLPILNFDDTLDQTDRQENLERWLKSFKPDAIISEIASIPDMLGAAGYRIPEDIAFAALSHLDGRSDSGINQDSHEIGRVATRTLVSLLHDGDRGIPKTMREILVHGEWVQGEMVEDRSGKVSLLSQ